MKSREKQLMARAQRVRQNVLRQVYVAGAGHTGGALSMVDIMVSVFDHHDQHHGRAKQQKLVISKGHAAAALYATLVEFGQTPSNLLDTYRGFNSPFQAHVKPPTKTTPGLKGYYPSGSLTHGLSLASGLAIAARYDSPSNPAPVYCIMGDTEMQGGQIWETANQIAFHKLSNVIAICDNNGLGNDYATAATLNVGNLRDRWASVGWGVIEVDGHNISELMTALMTADTLRQQPTIIIASTIKGKGISFIEGDNIWHGQAPDEKQFNQAAKELKVSLADQRIWTRARRARAKQEKLDLYPKDKTLRDGPADALLPLMKKDKDIIVIAPELAVSTRAAKLKDAFPDRVFNFGVQEPNAMDAVAGLRFAGKKPVIFTFANFALLRTVDQVFQNIASFKGTALIVGTHDELVQDGTSVIPYNHFAIARSFNDATVLAAADYYEARGLTKAAMQHSGFSFLFISRSEMPYIYDDKTQFTIGRARLHENHFGKDGNVIVAGSPFVWLAQQVVKKIYNQSNLDIGVINMSSISPLDEQIIKDAIHISSNLAVIEKHSPHGGLFSTVSEFLVRRNISAKVSQWPKKEWLGQSGSPEQQMKHLGLDQESLEVFLNKSFS